MKIIYFFTITWWGGMVVEAKFFRVPYRPDRVVTAGDAEGVR